MNEPAATRCCEICDGTAFVEIDFDSYALPTASGAPQFHAYRNFICERCGTVSAFPRASPEALAAYYNSDYRRSEYDIELGNRRIAPPVEIPWSGVSFKRFDSFYRELSDLVQRGALSAPGAGDFYVDYGGYQGLFLHACRLAWGVDGAVLDLSDEGVRFAQHALGFKRSKVCRDLREAPFDQPVSAVLMIHTLEHIERPRALLEHVRERVLVPGGFLYVEIPNLYGTPLSDPTHMHTFDEASLRYLLERCGFQPMKIWLSGYPELPEAPFCGPAMNLHCIASPAATMPQAPLPARTAHAVYQRLRRSGRRLGWSAALRESRRSFRHLARAIYASLMLLILDIAPPGLQRLLRPRDLLARLRGKAAEEAE